MLVRECDAGGVVRWHGCAVDAVRSVADGYEIDTTRGSVRSRRLVIASGGLSIPKIGASDFGYRIARQFGHRIVETRPALVPLTFAADEWQSLVATRRCLRCRCGCAPGVALLRANSSRTCCSPTAD